MKLTKIMCLIYIVSVFVITLILLPSNAGAAPSDDWSWTAAPSELIYSEPIKNAFMSVCAGEYRMKNIAGETALTNVCMNSGDKVNFGTALSSNGYFISLLNFSYEAKMYRFNGPCSFYDSCIYLPATDTLVTKQYLVNNYVRSLVVYKNFTKRTSRIISGLSFQYVFDSSNPDYVFRSDDGYAWPIGGFGASDDGAWLGIEFRQRGIGLLNMRTMQMKRVSTMAYSYGTGYDPSSEISVSNNGRQLVITGVNSGLSLFDITDDCGDLANDSNMSAVLAISRPCKMAQIDSSKFIDRFREGTRPKFSGDGGQFSFYATSYSQGPREVAIKASGYVTQKLEYLALGDSFTSGEGETDDAYYFRGTNEEFEKCHLSSRSYPYLIGRLSSINPGYVRSVACSGATAVDIIGSDYDYKGQGARLAAGGLNLNDADRIIYQTQARQSFLPGRIRQIGFVASTQPDVITIGIGGNDVGFMEKLRSCIGPDTCQWAGTLEGREKTALEIKRLHSKLVATYQALRAASPKSKIYAVSYPTVISQYGKCDLVTNKLFDQIEREFMVEGVKYLNDIIESATRAAGIGYLDVEDVYGDHALCGSKEPSAMSAVRTGDDISLLENNWLKVIGQESFHPTPYGHNILADKVNSIGNLSNHNYCADGSNFCPNNTPAPEPSTYWIPERVHDYPSLQVADFIANRPDSYDGRQKTIKFNSESFEPNSSVKITLTSDTVELGVFKIGEDGALDIDIDLPLNLPEGFHTIHVIGSSYSSEPIELYQVIKYETASKIVDPPIINNSITDQVGYLYPETQNILSNSMQKSANNADTEPILVTNFTESFNSYFNDQEVKGVSTVAGNKRPVNKPSKNNIFNLKFEHVALLVLSVVLGILVVKISFSHWGSGAR